MLNISKKLSYVLRHGGRKLGLNFKDNGYVKLGELLNLNNFWRKIKFKDIFKIVNSDKKKRFKIIKSKDGTLWIKASQGHTMIFPKLSQKRIISKEQLPTLVIAHGTYLEKKNKVLKEGLKVHKTKKYIYFRTNIKRDPRRKLDIFLDIDKCLKDKIKMFLSDNNVLMVKENLSPKYFLKVVEY
jgi:2'-phosphotransferase